MTRSAPARWKSRRLRLASFLSGGEARHGAIILSQMASVLQIDSPDAIRRIQRVQTVTIAWMSVEATISLFAAWRARSPALLAFGGDSAIELFSATVVPWRFRAGVDEHAERRACPCRRNLVVCACSVCRIHLRHESAGLWLNQTNVSRDSDFGRSRRRHAVACQREAASLRSYRQCCAEGGRRKSALCAYLSLIALAVLAINTIWHARWADPVAALVVVPLILWEGRETIRGKACGCC